jgi:cyclic pyranopterin phosphate synthase
MIDVSKKTNSLRTAIASARIEMSAETVQVIKDGRVPKGDIFTVAKVAATQAAKNTHSLIPYCHSMPIDYVGVTFTTGENFVDIRTEVKAVWKTGVEMEAITAASVAALTIYDMLKMIDDTVVIRDVQLIAKTGGKSDFREQLTQAPRAAVLVLSDSVAAGTKQDISGKLIEQRLQSEGIDVIEYCIIADDRETIASKLRSFADDLKVDLVLTTGGTGFSPRDATPEAMGEVIEKEIPGIAEAMRSYGLARTPYAMLSRAMAGQRGNTIIVNLPGSRRGVSESLDALFPALLHAFKMVQGGNHNESENRDHKAK